MSEKGEKMFQALEFDEVLADATKDLISGQPDLWKIMSEHECFADAAAAVKARKPGRFPSRYAIRLSEDPRPHNKISEFLRIDPERMPELAAYYAAAAERAEKSLLASGLYTIDTVPGPSFLLGIEYGTAIPELVKNTATAQTMGRKGGSSTSPEKVEKSRENGKKGGRPRKDS
jgi:hypothetical protein